MNIPEGYQVYRIEWVKRVSTNVLAKSQDEAERAAEATDTDDYDSEFGWEVESCCPTKDEPNDAVKNGEIVSMYDFEHERKMDEYASGKPWRPEWAPAEMLDVVDKYRFGLEGVITDRRFVAEGSLWLMDGGMCAVRTNMKPDPTTERERDIGDRIAKALLSCHLPFKATKAEPCMVSDREAIDLGPAKIRRAYFDMINEVHPGTAWHASGGNRPVYAVHSAQIVGVVMALRDEVAE